MYNSDKSQEYSTSTNKQTNRKTSQFNRICGGIFLTRFQNQFFFMRKKFNTIYCSPRKKEAIVFSFFLSFYLHLLRYVWLFGRSFLVLMLIGWWRCRICVVYKLLRWKLLYVPLATYIWCQSVRVYWVSHNGCLVRTVCRFSWCLP